MRGRRPATRIILRTDSGFGVSRPKGLRGYSQHPGLRGKPVRDLKTSLFADLCPSNLFGANALRLRFSAFAHIPRSRVAPAAGGKPAKAVPEKLRLLKTGAR